MVHTMNTHAWYSKMLVIKESFVTGTLNNVVLGKPFQVQRNIVSMTDFGKENM